MKYIVFALWCVILSVTTATAQSNYTIQPGDTLRIEVLEDPTLNRSVLVLPDGRFSFPFAGSVRAGGRSVDQVRQSVAAGIASNFAVSPNVFVAVNALRPKEPAVPKAEEPAPTIDVYFLGEVGAPGMKELQPGTTVLQAFASAGGFTRFAAQKRVQLRRTDRHGKQVVYTINYRALADGAVMSRDMVLRSGDVILVPERRLFE